MNNYQHEKWDQRWLSVAELFATWSKDPKRKVGAVIVTQDLRSFSAGYNGLPRGIEDTEDRLRDREKKLLLSVHAERNAMDNARFGLRGCSLYSTKFPCHECAKGIIQVGIVKVVAPPADTMHETWGESYKLALTLLQEARIKVFTRIFSGGGP